MYSRFKAFIFLTLLIFGTVGLIAFLQSGTLVGKEPQTVTGPVAIKTEKSAAASHAVALSPGVIPANWREDIGVPVLCYHQIVTDEKYRERPTPYAVTVSQFREQMAWLAEKNFYTILPDELLAYVRGEKKLDFSKGRPIVLTFDDGNNDFVDHAQKILDNHGFKGVLFIYPTYIFARKPRSLTWTQIKAVRKAGHAVESHTMWHPMLTTMTDTEQRAQFIDSKKNLDEKGGASVKHLAYPFGIYNAKSVELLREVGYASAYTTFHGGNQVGENPYLLRRFLLVKSDNAKIFAQKTLARSIPLRLLNSEPGGVIEGATTLKLGLPADLNPENFKVRIFSTAQNFEYTSKNGEMTVQVSPSKKRLSVLEIVYRENGVEYRANALLNHKRGVAGAETPKKLKKKKRKKKQRKQEV
jgi:peptidoglycan/xylan/chitin deacetylase (PgdA/CDA1 family)